LEEFIPDYSRGVGVDMAKACFFGGIVQRYVVSTVHPNREVKEFAKVFGTSGELRPRANQTQGKPDACRRE
jgi:hypothetical protein